MKKIFFYLLTNIFFKYVEKIKLVLNNRPLRT